MPEQNNTVSSLPETPFDLTRVLESIDDACYVLDSEWKFVYLNASAERLLRRTRRELLGRRVWDEFPEAEHAGFGRQYRCAVAERVAVTAQEFYPALDTWFEVRAFPFEDGLAVLFQDVGARKRAEHDAEWKLREGDALLRDTQVRLKAALSAGGIATWTYDLTTDRVVTDADLARLFSISDEDAAGGRLEMYLQAIYPDDRSRVAGTIADAIADKDVYEAEYRVVLSDGSLRWLATRGRVERDGSGQAVSLPGVVLDITEQIARRERERFLAELGERARALTEPDAVIADAVNSLGSFLRASRCVFADIDIEADACTVSPDYRADALVVSIAGTFPISAFGEFVVAEYKAGRTAVVDDVHTDRVKAPLESLPAYEAIGVRAYVAAPVMHSARLVSAIAVHSATPRQWKFEEVELIQTVVERAWLTVEVLRQQRALVHEAEEVRRAHARTTGILESISDAFIALDHEWCFTYINDQAERIVFQRRDEVLGRVFWDVFPAALGTTFEHMCRRAVNERIAVAFEEYFLPLDGWFEIRIYPSGGGLSLFFQNVNERKALEAERTQIADREHNIAQQLQAALTPSIPEHIPGMALAKYYEAALNEAGVGGDFYDVFSLKNSCTALIVGDLSGKGLAAASQVATVRNMLRYALYRAQTLAGALQSLNSLLVEQQELLTGFATLFVGAYDRGSGILTYVNCGQEPALIRRAAGGQVEQLGPTSPVLGSFEGVAFGERTVALGPGDALAVFTDGLTEVGRSRTEMLGVEGVAGLLAGIGVPEEIDGAEAVAELLALRLVSGVDAAARNGVTRDDVCLLVGVVSG